MRDEEIDKELRFHVDERVAELVAAGVTPDKARSRARLELGGMLQTREAVRDARAKYDAQLAARSAPAASDDRSGRPDHSGTPDHPDHE
jgi:hypothetical protein